ncbi:MAG: hypothetical protein KDK27_17775 [Leptospiraceae bacterium]|nr:hypothetical protein [Leptospiraceae bacterium]
MGIVVEAAGNEHVKIGIAGFAGSGDQVRAGDGAEFRTDKNTGTFFSTVVGFPLNISPFRTNEMSGPGCE